MREKEEYFHIKQQLLNTLPSKDLRVFPAITNTPGPVHSVES